MAIAASLVCAENGEIWLEGESVKVFFNDADTFRILEGPLKGKRVRVLGYNSLETYGPIHSWNGLNGEELLENARAATYMARTGGWSCSLIDDVDTYGRLLCRCDDLAISLLRNGLAHVFSVDKNPGDSEYLKYQKYAQEQQLGIWLNGVPKYIITSLHSAKENEQGNAYDRLISTSDGSSKKREHKEHYKTCEIVCIERGSSCMVYVPFRERYGDRRPYCLRAIKKGENYEQSYGQKSSSRKKQEIYFYRSRGRGHFVYSSFEPYFRYSGDGSGSLSRLEMV